MELVKMIAENVTVRTTLLVTNAVNVLANTMDFLIAKVCKVYSNSFKREVLLNPYSFCY